LLNPIKLGVNEQKKMFGWFRTFLMMKFAGYNEQNPVSTLLLLKDFNSVPA